MQEYLQFFLHHWVLSLIFIASFVWVIMVEAKSKSSNGLGVATREAVTLINKQNAKLFDIRPAEQFAQGHIVGAKNVSADQLDSNNTSLKLKAKQTIIVICARGMSAQAVVKKLRQAGFAQAYVLTGGMQAWAQADMPVVQQSES